GRAGAARLRVHPQARLSRGARHAVPVHAAGPDRQAAHGHQLRAGRPAHPIRVRSLMNATAAGKSAIDRSAAWRVSPHRRSWMRFCANRRGYYSLWIFAVLFVISLGAEFLSNDRPIAVQYQGEYFFPLFVAYPETTFGGDFETEADYTDPYVRDLLSPDDRGRDVRARLIYGFRLSVLFAFALTAVGVVLGVVAGAVQGYFGGRLDLFAQRLIEIWSSMPELYLLIIFASLFNPSILLLLVLLSLFGWMGLADYVRAEFLRGRNMDYVKAARAIGLSNRRIMFRHLLPNSLTPVITFLPFRISGAILALTSLDFLGLGVPPSTPSLGELLAQGKENIEAWWLSMTTFVVLV